MQTEDPKEPHSSSASESDPNASLGEGAKKESVNTPSQEVVANLGLQTFFRFERKAFNIATAVVYSVALTFIFYVFKEKELVVSRDTMAQLLSYTASFAALCIALPAFLKDSSTQDTLYRAFLLLALLYTVATITGIITLIFNGSVSFSITLNSKLPELFIVPVGLRVLLSISDLLPSNHQEGKWNLDYYKVFEFVITLIVIGCALPYSTGESAALILMVLYASLYFLSLIFALLIQMLFMTHPKKKSVIESYIQELVDKHTEKAYSLETLHQHLINTFKDVAISKNALKRLLLSTHNSMNDLRLTYFETLDLILPIYNFTHLFMLKGNYQKKYYVYVGDADGFDKEVYPLLLERLSKLTNYSKPMIANTPELNEFLKSIKADFLYVHKTLGIFLLNSEIEPSLYYVVNSKDIDTKTYLEKYLYLLNDAMPLNEVIDHIIFHKDLKNIHITKQPMPWPNKIIFKKPKK